jgi:hypothetical protein
VNEEPSTIYTGAPDLQAAAVERLKEAELRLSQQDSARNRLELDSARRELAKFQTEPPKNDSLPGGRSPRRRSRNNRR